MIKLKDLLLEHLIEEGLIWTHDIEKTVIGLNSNLPSHIDNIFFAQIDDAHRIQLVITDGKITSDLLEWILKSINNRGWFPAYFYVFRNSMRSENKFQDLNYFKKYLNKNDKIVLIFDAKYDKSALFDRFDNGVGYHITPIIKGEKIDMMGLSPKSKSQIAAHLDRVYLAYNIGGIEELFQNSRFCPNEYYFVVYEININKLLKDKNIQLYEDAAFKDEGVYTMNNIPPQYIKFLKTLSRK